MRERELVAMRHDLQRLATQPPRPAQARATAAAALEEAIATDRLRIRLLALTVSPGAAQEPRNAARRALTLRIEGSDAGVTGHRRSLAIGAIAAAVILAVATAAVVWRQQPASALAELARAVERLPASEFGAPVVERASHDERLVVVDLAEHSVPVLEVADRIDRIDRPGMTHRTETITGVVILNEGDEVHRAQIEELLNVGATTDAVFGYAPSDLSSLLTESPSYLIDRLERQYAASGDPSVPFSVFALDRMVALHIALTPSPAQRAAILATVDHLAPDSQHQSERGTTATFRFDGPTGVETREVTFDRYGWLTQVARVFDEGSSIDRIPPGTTTILDMSPPSEP